MRTFCSAVLVFAFVALGGLALAAHTTAHTLLHPDRATQTAERVAGELVEAGVLDGLLDTMVSDAGLRESLDSRLASAPGLREDVADQLAKADQLDPAATQRKLARTLRQAGYPDLARQVRQQPLPAPGQLSPGDAEGGASGWSDLARDTVAQWRSTLTRFAVAAGLAALLCAGVGIAAARSRRNVARGVGNTLIVTLGLTAVVFLGIPGLLGAVSGSGWWAAFADGAKAAGSEVVTPLLPLLLGGIILRVAAPHLPERGVAVAGSGRPGTPAVGRFGDRSGLPGAETHTHLADPHGSFGQPDPRHR